MRHERLEHTDAEHAPRDEPGLGAPAGVFLLQGGYHVAAFGGRAASRLRDRGALLIASLHFGPVEGRLREPPIQVSPLRAPGDLPRLGGASGEN